MAGQSRTLKLSILADVDQLKKSLQTANGDVEQSSSRLGDFSKKAGLAFAVAGAAAAAYAGKLLIDGVKAAIEDEAAQVRLATSLQNTTGATNAQIAAVEAQILKTSLLTGKTDDELRPSLDRLVRSTKSITEAQKLQALALDISAGSGKSLEAVSNALAKGFEGNTTALGKLGVGISAAELKSMSFEQVQAKLAATFEGQSSKQADTFAGKMERLKVAFAEGKETVGAFVLDAITPLINTVVNTVIPAISTFINSIGGKEGLKGTFDAVFTGIKNFVLPIIQGLKVAFDQVKATIMENADSFETLFKFLSKYVAPFFGGYFKLVIQGFGTALSIVLTVLARIIDAFEKVIELGKKVGDIFKGIFGNNSVGSSSLNVGTFGTSSGNNPRIIGAGQTVNITVNGAIDPIGTARQIAQILSREATTSGTFTNLGVSKVVSFT